jgi:hypothetical protein
MRDAVCQTDRVAVFEWLDHNDLGLLRSIIGVPLRSLLV